MSFPAQVFRVLIASPSDVKDEREIAVKTIQEWNDLNAAERQFVLLPLRWETHGAPEYGKRPQEIINRQVVDHCDLLVGIFWTRVGSPTGAADSGTVEEIERVATSGKPVMLYFSQAMQDPDKLDLEQLAKLREFKKKTFPKALVETYADHVEFKEKLSKQIDIQLRSLLAERSEQEPQTDAIRPITDIVLHFADPETGEDEGTDRTINTQFIDVVDFEAIPDFTPPKVERPPEETVLRQSTLSEIWLTGLKDSDTNKNYYRQRVTSLVVNAFFAPLRFWLKNNGGIGARDVFIDLKIKSKAPSLVLISKDELPVARPSKSSSGYGLLGPNHPVKPDEVIVSGSDVWTTQIDVPALQPQRELSPKVEFLIGAKESCDVIVSARIFADTLSQPSVQEITLRLNVDKHVVPANEIVEAIIKPNAPSGEGGA